MRERKYTNIKVLTRVRCMSDGHHWFTVTMDGGATRAYSPGFGFDSLSSSHWLGWNAPQYLMDEVDRQIAQGFKENRFIVWERTADDGERYAPELRYHSQEMVDHYIKLGEPLMKKERTP